MSYLSQSEIKLTVCSMWICRPISFPIGEMKRALELAVLTVRRASSIIPLTKEKKNGHKEEHRKAKLDSEA